MLKGTLVIPWRCATQNINNEINDAVCNYKEWEIKKNMGLMRNKVWELSKTDSICVHYFRSLLFLQSIKNMKSIPTKHQMKRFYKMLGIGQWYFKRDQSSKTQYMSRVYSIGTKPNQQEANETKHCQYCLERFSWYIRGYVEQLYGVQLAITNFGICIYMIVASFPCTVH